MDVVAACNWVQRRRRRSRGKERISGEESEQMKMEVEMIDENEERGECNR